MKRINSLQGLRAIAFATVFLGHSGIFGLLTGMGVSIFFVLSGFLMVYNYMFRELPHGIKESFLFASSKIKKLYPLHLVMMIPMLGLALIGTVKSGSPLIELVNMLPKIASNVLLIQAWIPVRDYYFGFNGVAWYLSVTLFLYFCFPLIMKTLKRIKNKIAIIAIISAALVIQLLAGYLLDLPAFSFINTNWFTYIFPLYRLGDFLVGCCAGYYFITQDKSTFSIIKSSILEALAILVLAGSCIISGFCSVPEGLNLSFKYLPGAVFLVFALAQGNGIIAKILSCKPIVRIGNISGYMYLIHQVVLNVADTIGLSVIQSAVLSLIISMMLSLLYIRIMSFRYKKEK